MPNDENDIESSVERVKKMLEKRDAASHLHSRRQLHADDTAVRGVWEQSPHAPVSSEDAQRTLESLKAGRMPDQDPLAEALYQAQHSSVRLEDAEDEHKVTSRFIKTLFYASAVFFVFAAGVAAYFLLYSGRQVSCDNISVDVRGPASIASGKELVLNVNVLNKNVIPVENVQVFFEYPEGARSPDNTTTPLPVQREQVGTIDAGERVRTTGHVVLYGKEQVEQNIDTRVEFTIKDSNASWSCMAPYTVTLATAPVIMSVTGLEQVSSGQELELTVEVHSNSNELVRSVRLVATYPYGFDFLSAEPKPAAKDSVWDIGDIQPGTNRTITIRGKINGYSNESRSVDFEIGEASQNDDGELGVILQAVSHKFMLSKPFLSTALTLDESVSGDYNTSLGEVVEGELTYLNDSNEALHNVEIEAVVPGIMVDRKSVRVNGGYFRSSDGTMLWTPQTKESLTTIEPGQTGTITFSFKTVPFVKNTAATNPSMMLSFDIKASRISNNIPVEQSLTAQAQRAINFITDVELSSYALYSAGPFTNTGTHPPRVDEETSYTVVWRIDNTTNALTNANVVGELPVNVSWLNAVSPSSEDVSFNPVTRKVTWSIGDVAAGTGYQGSPRQVAFKVSVTPSVTQEGDTIDILSEVSCTGVDAFTGTMVQRGSPNVTTRLLNDPYFPEDDGRVRE